MVYGIFCDKENCKQLYIGKTERKLKERLAEHKGSVRNNAKNVIGVHFNGPGHYVENLKISAIEKNKYKWRRNNFEERILMDKFV